MSLDVDSNKHQQRESRILGDLAFPGNGLLDVHVTAGLIYTHSSPSPFGTSNSQTEIGASDPRSMAKNFWQFNKQNLQKFMEVDLELRNFKANSASGAKTIESWLLGQRAKG